MKGLAGDCTRERAGQRIVETTGQPLNTPMVSDARAAGPKPVREPPGSSRGRVRWGAVRDPADGTVDVGPEPIAARLPR